MPKTRARLDARSVSFTIGEGKDRPGHPITVNLGYDPETHELVEVAFAEAGKIGQGIQILLAELGLKLSRAIQSRNPETGDEVTDRG